MKRPSAPGRHGHTIAADLPPAGESPWLSQLLAVHSDGNLAVGVLGAAVIVGLGVAAVTYSRLAIDVSGGGRARRKATPRWSPTCAST